MKKISLIICAIALIVLTLSFVGCGHEHKWGEWTTVTEATCTKTGSQERVCQCGEKETQEIAALGHTAGNKATCTTAQICTVCDAELAAALGHTAGDEATCTTAQICTVCDAELVAALGHTDGEWIIDTEATCTEDGSKHQVCSVCKATITIETISATGHDYNETITKATAENNASVKFDCKTCGTSETKEYTPIAVYASLTGSGMTWIGSGMYYTRSFEVTASGGYGEYQYRFASGSNILQDFSSSNECEIYGNVFIDLSTITITVKDEVGQQTVYEIKGNGSYINSYVIYE